jgi:hypothetical protein
MTFEDQFILVTGALIPVDGGLGILEAGPQ